MRPALALIAASCIGVSARSCEKDLYYQGYEDRLESENGTTLLNTLREIISGHNRISYDDCWEALKMVDAFEGNTSSGLVHLVYKDVGWPANDTAGNGVVGGSWNREHVYPKSYGVGTSGPDTSDLHSLRAADSNVNSARNNLYFDFCELDSGCTVPAHSETNTQTGKDSDRFMPPVASRGDVARSLFYMQARYDGSEPYTENLQLTNCPNATAFMLGKLATLLEWHQLDPPSFFEKHRNNAICVQYQGNRNPFIDFPHLVERIYVGADWIDPAGPSCLSNPTPTVTPMPAPTLNPSASPSLVPSAEPTTLNPTFSPSSSPVFTPTEQPAASETRSPSFAPAATTLAPMPTRMKPESGDIGDDDDVIVVVLPVWAVWLIAAGLSVLLTTSWVIACCCLWKRASNSRNKVANVQGAFLNG